MKTTPDQLIKELSSIVDKTFADAIVISYVEMQNRFLAGDWKPAELDGGRLCEALSRALLQLDQGAVNHKNLPGIVRDNLLDVKSMHTHLLSLKDRTHITKVIDVVYKFRSDRGAVHISPLHTANYMDSMVIVHAAKWIFAEFLRIAWKKDRNAVAAVIEQIVQLQHSLIHELDGKPMVLARGASAPEEVLLLLFNAQGNRLTRAELKSYVTHHSPTNVSTAVSRLITSKDIRSADNNQVALTPNGQRRVVEDILIKYRQQ